MKRGDIVKKLMISVGFLAFSFMLHQPLDADAAWSKTASNRWVYYDEAGNLLTSRWIGGKYYVGKDGIMYTNRWAPSSIGDCFVGEDGKWVPDFKGGWQKISGKWYYYSPEGDKLTGWQQVKGKRYYMNSSGAMLSNGWKKIDNVWYYLESSGSAATNGWKRLNNKWYYFDESGRMQTGFVNSKGRQYYCNDNGAMLTGWKKIDGIYYYMDGNGAIQTNKWLMSGGRWYYVQSDGKMGTGWVSDKGKTYYCNSSGVMLTGWQLIEGNYYYFNEDGAMLNNRWFRSGSKWYYLQADGRMAVGFIDVNGKTYYCNGSGAMLTGWQMIEGTYYYFNGSGDMVTHEWKRSGSSWYYLQDNGMMATGLIEVDGEIYYCSDNGVMLTGWKSYNSHWYYFARSGQAVTGLQNIMGKTYYFNNAGIMLTNTTVSTNGKTYVIDNSGICTEKTNSTSTGVMQNLQEFYRDRGSIDTNYTYNDDLLFLGRYEANWNYAQVGGASGRSCGFYQFDIEHTLPDIINYCYESDKKKYAEFKPFIGKRGDALLNNKSLYKAWVLVYNRDPSGFKKVQDDFAYKVYYKSAVNYFASGGILIANRHDAVKGAVFSAAIRHGSYGAYKYAMKAGLRATDSDEVFLTKFYQTIYENCSVDDKNRYYYEAKEAMLRLKNH